MTLLNPVNPIDLVFLFVVLGIIAVCVLIYFLIPVFNKKQYEEQRENLHKREEAFNRNRSKKEN